MIKHARPISSLLIGISILVVGSGMLSTLISIQGEAAGMSPLVLGVIMAGFYLGYILGNKGCPLLIHRVGHIRSFTVFAALAACSALLYPLLPGDFSWFMIRVINGLAIVGLYMIIESWLSHQASDARGQIFAAYMLALMVALGIGQYVLLIYGPQSVLSFVVVGVLFILGLIPVALTNVPQPDISQAQSISYRELFHYSPVGVVGTFVSGIVSGSFWALSPSYALALGLDEVGVANFISAAIFGGIVFQWPIGKLSDHMDRRLLLLYMALLTCPVLLLLFIWPSMPLVAMLMLCAVYGGVIFSLYAVAVTQTHDRVPTSQALDAVNGLLLIYGVGAVIGPVLCGAFMSYFGKTHFTLFNMLILLGVTLYIWWRIKVDPPVMPNDRVDYVIMTNTSSEALTLDPRADDHQDRPYDSNNNSAPQPPGHRPP